MSHLAGDGGQFARLTRSQVRHDFHCQTNLVDTFRALFPTELKFEDNRAIVFNEHDGTPTDSLAY